MKIKMEQNGVICLSRESHDGNNLVLSLWQGSSLLIPDVVVDQVCDLYDTKNWKKYQVTGENQSMYANGQVVTLVPSDMTIDDIAGLGNGLISTDYNGQPDNAYRVGDKCFFVPYVVNPRKKDGKLGFLVFDMNYHFVADFCDASPNVFTSIKGFLKNAGISCNLPASCVDGELILKRAGYRKFYYTYGSNKHFPFKSGWTEIVAPSMSRANAKFRDIHPDVNDGYLNCAFVYDQDEFPMDMASAGNYGVREQEILIG